MFFCLEEALKEKDEEWLSPALVKEKFCGRDNILVIVHPIRVLL